MAYDINAARAARGETWDVVLDDITYHMRREVPMELLERVEELEATPGVAGIVAILKILLEDEADSFPFSSLSPQDIIGLFDAYRAEVAPDLGESSPSPSSSKSTARRSTQTSKRSTASTSRTRTAAGSRRGASKP